VDPQKVIFQADGELRFIEAQIGGDLDLSAGRINSTTDVALDASSAKIAGAIFLRGGFTARGKVGLDYITLGADLNCVAGKILNADGSDALSVANAKITGNVTLTRASLEGYVDFTDSELSGFLILDQSKSMRKATCLFESAKVGTLEDYTKSWGRNPLVLDGFVYNRFANDSPTDAKSRLAWLKKMGRDQFHPQPYEQLATVLRDMGYEDQVADVLVQMNKDHGRYIHNQLGLKQSDPGTKPEAKSFLSAWIARLTSKDWWWYNGFGWLIGYGQNPLRALCISLGFIAFGYGVFRIGNAYGLMWPTDDGEIRRDSNGEPISAKGVATVSEDYTRFNAFIYSLETFTPLLQLDQNGRWRPNANRGIRIRFLPGNPTAGSLLRGYLWVHIILGWVLTSLWVGAITGLVKS
jgi:hypothetical protein